MQFPRPMAEGVEVSFTVIDSNNNSYEVGKTTTDSSGTYAFVWTPEISGKYTIIANFGGSKAYWPSYAETAMNVLEEEPHPTQDVTSNPTMPPFELYLALATVAIIVAIAIVGFLLLKKRP
jgi:hypothetical protein